MKFGAGDVVTYRKGAEEYYDLFGARTTLHSI